MGTLSSETGAGSFPSHKNKKRVWKILLSSLAIVVSLTFVALQLNPLPKKVNFQPHVGLGQVVAEEIHRLTERGGGIVLLYSSAHPRMGARAQKIELETFRKTLEAESIKVSAEINVPADQIMDSDMGSHLSGNFFLNLLQQHPKAKGIVSFIGAPNFTEEDYVLMPSSRPKVLVVCQTSDGLQPLFDENVVQGAIVPLTKSVPSGTRSPKTPREWFDQSFTLLTGKDFEMGIEE